MCQHKVAFLNLSLNSFNHRIIWNSFFEQGDKDIFNLYIHSKDKKCFLFKDYFIKNTVPTKWGHFSLVEATIELMKTALKDEQNEYFTLISDSHLPLYNLNDTVKLIKERYTTLTFSKASSPSGKALKDLNLTNTTLYVSSLYSGEKMLLSL